MKEFCMCKRAALAALFFGSVLTGCIPSGAKPDTKAMVVLDPIGTSSIKGRITLGDQDGLTRIFIDVTGLTGEHGFHIHEESDCRRALANLSKGHFNPDGKPHGQHLGDLPNIRSDVYGTMRDAIFAKSVALTGKDSVIGHTMIITSHYDDYQTQPDGRSGQAIACGVITPI
jgi:Cu-Zn family superoxide dismutase